ncbi:MAG: carbohydrate ABC transporter permease [Planctomycetes bacterium]|nr:carbohydrate ABC transporter permease [Planctomycetota bacterium]
MKKGNLLQSIVVHALLIIGAIAFMFPLYWMVVTALKTLPEVLQSPPLWFPKKLLWSNFKTAINIIPFWTYTMNTVIVCVLSVIGTLISSTLVAYAFSRLQWKGREFTFKCVLATMMIPFPVLMVPLFVLFSKIGWVGSLKPLWAPTFFASAFNIFLLRQFFMTIPMELSEAARIDGCSEFGILVRIILPLSKPVLLVVALFQFIYSWNDFLAPLIYLTRQETFTLSLGLQFYQSQQGGSQWNYLMAAATLVVLPVLVLYFIAQRYFIEGISLTGVKG